MVEKWEEVPGNGPFIAKNCVEVTMNTIHFCRHALADFEPWVRRVCNDYLTDPEAVLGPGPSDLAALFFGPDFKMFQFEAVRSSVNRLCSNAVVEYCGYRLQPGSLTGPQMQSLWCKLKGGFHDYRHQSLGKHARRVGL